MDQEKIEARFDKLEIKVDRVLDALTGNEELGSRGLVYRVTSLEKWGKWAAMTMGGVILTATVGGLLKLFII